MPSGVTIQAVSALAALADGLFGDAVPAVAAESSPDCDVSDPARRVSVEQLAAAATRIAIADRVRTGALVGWVGLAGAIPVPA